MATPPLRVAVLAYRGNPHSGGQGVYTRYLAVELRDLGHEVDVIAGPPYPEVEDDGITLHRLASMDMYRPERPFRPSRLPRSKADWVELGVMSTGTYCEPHGWSVRVDHWMKEHGHNYDVIHDNQCLGYGIARIAQRQPLLATMHHPITVDRDLELDEQRPAWRHLRRQVGLRRWYAFLRMQKRVSRQLPRILTVSQTSRKDIIEQIGVKPDRIDVVPVGVDATVFRPRPEIAKVPGRILAVISSDVPLKGMPYLIEAVAKLRTEVPHAHLVVIGRQRPQDQGHKVAAKFGLGEDAVQFTGSIPFERMLELYGEAEVAAVPSLYEGFSLPSVQAMASKIPLVCTRAGAIPEVAGTDGETALLVPPGDAGALAIALKRMLGDKELQARLSEAAYERALRLFTWTAMAKQTAEQYHILIDKYRAGTI